MAGLHVREIESSHFRKRYQINVCWIIFNDNVYQIFCLTQCRCFLSNSIFWILIQKFSLTVPPIQSVCPHFTCWSKSFTETYEKEFTSYLVWEGSNYGECISLPEFLSYLYLLRSFKLLRDHEIYHGSSSFLYEFFQGRYIISRNENTHLVLFQFCFWLLFSYVGRRVQTSQ